MANKKDPTPKPTDDPAPAPETKPTEEPAPAAAPAEKSFTQADIDAAVKKAQKDWEKKAKDDEDRASLSETERANAERDDALQKLRERDARDSVTEAATAAGVKNAKLFYNAYKSELEFDDKGNITNLKDVLASAKTEAAELFTAAPQPQGSADAGEGKNTNSGGLTREMIEKMSPNEIAENMDKIDAFMASQK